MARRMRSIQSAQLAAIRQQLLDALPDEVSLLEIEGLCRWGFDRKEIGCRDGEHSLAATTDFLRNDDSLYSVRDAVVAWLAVVGGVCDCTIQSRALRTVLRLSQE